MFLSGIKKEAFSFIQGFRYISPLIKTGNITGMVMRSEKGKEKGNLILTIDSGNVKLEVDNI